MTDMARIRAVFERNATGEFAPAGRGLRYLAALGRYTAGHAVPPNF
jgi:hypothetical protein